MSKSTQTLLGLLLTVLALASLVYSGRTLLLAAGNESAETTLAKAEALNAKKDYKASLDLLMGAVNEQPDNNILRDLLRKTFVLHLQSEVANGYQRVSANKHDVEAYLNVAKAFNLVDDHFRSMEVLTSGAIENPKSVRLWLAIGLQELDQRRDAEAASVFREVLRLDEKSGAAHNDLAFIESRSRNPRLLNLSDALHHAQTAVSLEPTNPNYIDTLAEIQFLRGYKSEAVKLIKQAIRYDPDEPYYHSQLEKFERGDEASLTSSGR